jgi:hypothetical protein
MPPPGLTSTPGDAAATPTDVPHAQVLTNVFAGPGDAG